MSESEVIPCDGEIKNADEKLLENFCSVIIDI